MNYISMEKLSSIPLFPALDIFFLSGGYSYFVIANYRNEPFLWLDDYWNNDDFKTFIQRENIITWETDKVAQFADFLVQTKFHFLLRPRVIHHASDIPFLSQEKLNLIKLKMSDRTALEQDQLEEDQRVRLEKIADQIQPPKLQINEHGTGEFDFYIWTQLYGMVIHIQCQFGTDGAFDYSGQKVEAGIGNFFRDL